MGIYTYTYAYAYTYLIHLCTPSAAPSLPPSLLPPHALLHATRAPSLARKDWGFRFGVAMGLEQRIDPMLSCTRRVLLGSLANIGVQGLGW